MRELIERLEDSWMKLSAAAECDCDPVKEIDPTEGTNCDPAEHGVYCNYRINLEACRGIREAIAALAAEQPPAPAERERIVACIVDAVWKCVDTKADGSVWLNELKAKAAVRAALDAAAQGGEQHDQPRGADCTAGAGRSTAARPKRDM